MRQLLFLGLALLMISSANGQLKPEPANIVLQSAREQALKENKNVFIIFHASWCGWCHKMDSALNDPKVKKFFQDNYIFRHLSVLEHGDNKILENPGALEMLEKFGGKEEGIPYWVVLDTKGTLLADSRIDGKAGKNSGCPASQEEVEYFISVLQKTSKLQAEALELIRKRFRENEVR